MWKNHGTKILGSIMGIIGIAITLTPEQLTAIFGDHAPGVAVILGGLATIYRGFQNSGTLPGGPSKPE